MKLTKTLGSALQIGSAALTIFLASGGERLVNEKLPEKARIVAIGALAAFQASVGKKGFDVNPDGSPCFTPYKPY